LRRAAPRDRGQRHPRNNTTLSVSSATSSPMKMKSELRRGLVLDSAVRLRVERCRRPREQMEAEEERRRGRWGKGRKTAIQRYLGNNCIIFNQRDSRKYLHGVLRRISRAMSIRRTDASLWGRLYDPDHVPREFVDVVRPIQ